MHKDTTVLISFQTRNMHLDCLSRILKLLTLGIDTCLKALFFYEAQLLPLLFKVFFAFFETQIFVTTFKVWKSSNLMCRGLGPKDTNRLRKYLR